MHLASFTFNPFGENTYVIYDETKRCVIIDPGCNTDSERDTLTGFIASSNLQPVALVNTFASDYPIS